uniref:Uncharacterized protein n=1 Tax=Biomphalaria glabrata TaxID=6526 RepID=A0A2C9L0W6_BIOGL
MDYHKELAVLKFVNILWGKELSSLFTLKDGEFFVFVIHLIDPMAPTCSNSESDDCRLTYVRTFLQDFYGQNTNIETFIKFDILLREMSSSEQSIKLELAKISIALLGIGLLGESKNVFINSALGVPQDLQEDVLDIVQSVIVPDSTEVLLTDSIDYVLRQPIERRRQSPVQDLMKSEEYVNSVEKNYFLSPLIRSQTPDRRVNFQDESYLRELSSPFSALDIKSPSSSLINLTRSPQFIQKAVIKQKDLELRKLREALNSEIIQKEEVEATLQEKLSELANKDNEIYQLRDRIRELQNVSLSCADNDDVNSKAEIKELKQKVYSLEKYREKCETLEVNNRLHAEEISRLHQKIKSMDSDVTVIKKFKDAVHQLELQVQKLQDELQVMISSKAQWEDEKRCLCCKLEVLRDSNTDLKQQLEELQGRMIDGQVLERLDSSGESMGVVADIQIGELKEQMEGLEQDKQNLLHQLELCQKELEKVNSRASSHEHSQTVLRETISNLNSALTIEKDTNQKMKVHMDSLMMKYKEVTLKNDQMQKENEASAAEISRLTTSLDETVKQLQTLQKQQTEKSDKSCVLQPLKEPSQQKDKLTLHKSCSGKNTLTETNSIRTKPRLSSGYDSPEKSSPSLDTSFVTVSLKTLTEETKSGRACFLRKSSTTDKCEEEPLLKRDRVPTSSLQSMKDLLQSFLAFLAGVFPNAMACANEPEENSFEWDKLSRIRDAVNPLNMNESSEKKVNPFRDDGRIQKRKLPLRPSLSENIEMVTPVKQKKTSGTVIYFPLNPDGPIYPPPKPTLNYKGKSGRPNKEIPDSGVPSLLPSAQKANSENLYSVNWRTNP